MRRLGPLTLAVIIMVVIDAATTPALLLAYHLSPSFYVAHAFSDTAYLQVDMAMTLWAFATMFVFCVWILRAGNNLVALGHADLEFTPASRIWWFVVPIFNLVKPYQGMRELWNASHEKPDHADTVPVIAVWWAMWLLCNFAGMIFFVFAGGIDPVPALWVQSAANIALAAAAIPVLRGIALAQAEQRSATLAEVFA